MRVLARVRSWIRDAATRARFEREMADEFRSHIAHRADDLERAGLACDVARRTARIEFGSVEGYKEMGREARGLRIIDELRADVRFAWRNVRASPLLSATVVVTLALGVGISSSVFAVVDAVSLRPRVEGDTRTFVRVLSAYGTDSSPPGFPAPRRCRITSRIVTAVVLYACSLAGRTSSRRSMAIPRPSARCS